MKITPINGSTETDGVKHMYRGQHLIIARAGNNEFKKVFRELMKPVKEDFDKGRLSEDESDKFMIECVAKTILVGWVKLKDAEGNEHEYNLDNALSLLTDDRDAYDSIIAFSENIDNYLVGQDEALKGKSSAS